jgi:hypothetical protein
MPRCGSRSSDDVRPGSPSLALRGMPSPSPPRPSPSRTDEQPEQAQACGGPPLAMAGSWWVLRSAHHACWIACPGNSRSSCAQASRGLPTEKHACLCMYVCMRVQPWPISRHLRHGHLQQTARAGPASPAPGESESARFRQGLCRLRPCQRMSGRGRRHDARLRVARRNLKPASCGQAWGTGGRGSLAPCQGRLPAALRDPGRGGLHWQASPTQSRSVRVELSLCRRSDALRDGRHERRQQQRQPGYPGSAMGAPGLEGPLADADSDPGPGSGRVYWPDRGIGPSGPAGARRACAVWVLCP